MDSILLGANAKLNLSLDIVGLRDDGYHLMDMVNQSAALRDDVSIRRAPQRGVRLRTNWRYLPTDSRNSARKAAEAVLEHSGRLDAGLDIFIKKRIPTQSGLGGGSADAAAVLVGANRLLGLGLGDAELRELGAKIGADVPFCLVGGAARVGGIGELIEPLPPLSDCWFLILMPRRGNSTRELFGRIDAAKGYRRPETDAMERAVKAGDAALAAILLCNVFDTSQAAAETAEFKRRLLASGALGASLSGSGAAVFGVFKDGLSATRAKKQLARYCNNAYVARAASHGVEILEQKPK